MNIGKALTAPIRMAGAGLKAFAMRWSGMPGASWLLLPRTKFDYSREVGDGTGSSIVVAVVGWIARNFPEAPLVVVEERPDGMRVPVRPHAMADLIERPNPYYSGPLLWMATIADRAITGNAYWIKVRSESDKPVQLWWAPSFTMEPKWPTDGNTYISHYEYRPGGGQTIRYDPKDVVHFRWGLDLRNPRKGMAPLYSVLREIFTDDEAANFTASLMRNLGVPGVIIAPDVPNAKVSKEDADEVKRDFKANFGGDNRGEPMVMKAPTKVQVLSFSPEQMLLRDLRRIPEERVSAVFGVPAIVAGLGAGLDRATYDNAEKLVEFAVEQNIIPTQRIIASELRTQLLADFDTKPNHLVDFDLSRVRALQPDQDKLYERIDRAVLHGWATVAEAKRIVGLPVLSGDDVYLRMLAYQSVPATKAARELATKAAGGGFPDALALARRRLAERSEAEIIKFFESQARRVRARLARVVNLRSANGSKQIVSPVFLIPAEEDGLLIEAMQPLWLAGIDLGWTMADDAFSLGAAFDPADAIVAALLAEASFRAVRINGGTRANIGEALAEAERVGYTVQQIVRGVEADGFMGLADRVESYYANRPLAIARTESMWSTGMGTSGAYQRAGVQRVMMIDPGDDPACAARNGRIVTVAQGQSALGDEHVHGNLALVPV